MFPLSNKEMIQVPTLFTITSYNHLYVLHSNFYLSIPLPLQHNPSHLDHGNQHDDPVNLGPNAYKFKAYIITHTVKRRVINLNNETHATHYYHLTVDSFPFSGVLISFACFTLLLSLPPLSLLSEEEPHQGYDGESTEANGSNIKRHVASSDCLDFKEVGSFFGVSVLTVSHFVILSVESVGAYEVRGGRHVALDGPLKGLVGVAVGP